MTRLRPADTDRCPRPTAIANFERGSASSKARTHRSSHSSPDSSLGLVWYRDSYCSTGVAALGNVTVIRCSERSMTGSATPCPRAELRNTPDARTHLLDHVHPAQNAEQQRHPGHARGPEIRLRHSRGQTPRNDELDPILDEVNLHPRRRAAVAVSHSARYGHPVGVSGDSTRPSRQPRVITSSPSTTRYTVSAFFAPLFNGARVSLSSPSNREFQAGLLEHNSIGRQSQFVKKRLVTFLCRVNEAVK